MKLRAVAAAAAILALTTWAHAQRLELAGRVTSPASGADLHALADGRHVALSDLRAEGGDAVVDVLDVTTAQTTMLRVTPDALAPFHPPGTMLTQRGELITLDATKGGLHLHDELGTPALRHWYVEVDRKTKAVARHVALGTTSPGESMHFLATDRAQHVAWFWIERSDDIAKVGPKLITFRKLDLRSLVVTDALAIRLAARRPTTFGALYVFASDDCERFAVAEYGVDYEAAHPPAALYVVNPAAASWFSLRAPDTPYVAKFSHDAAQLFVSSAGSSKITTIDVAAGTKTAVAAVPAITRQLVVTETGHAVLALTGDSTTFTALDAPRLGRKRSLSLDDGLKATGFGRYLHSAVTPDGRYVVSAAWRSGAPANEDTTFVVARVVE